MQSARAADTGGVRFTVRHASPRFLRCPTRSAALTIVVAGLIGIVAGSGRAGGVEQPDPGVALAARRVESQLIAPCCFSQTVDNHSSPLADEIKRDVIRRLRAGESEAAILAAYRGRYGDRILAAPPASGFNVLAYVMPPLFFAAGVATAAWWLRRRLRQPRAHMPGPAAAVDPRLQARFDTELACLDP